VMEPGKITITAGGGATVVLDANALTQAKGGGKTLHDANVLHQSNGGARCFLTPMSWPSRVEGASPAGRRCCDGGHGHGHGDGRHRGHADRWGATVKTSPQASRPRGQDRHHRLSRGQRYGRDGEDQLGTRLRT